MHARSFGHRSPPKSAGRARRSLADRHDERPARHPLVEGMAAGKDAQRPAPPRGGQMRDAGIVGDDIGCGVDGPDELGPAQIPAGVAHPIRGQRSHQIVRAGALRARADHHDLEAMLARDELDELTILLQRPLPDPLVGEWGQDDRRGFNGPHRAIRRCTGRPFACRQDVRAAPSPRSGGRLGSPPRATAADPGSETDEARRPASHEF